MSRFTITLAGSRWAQLTYTSFDPGGSAAGGWQVKQTIGEPSESERDYLLAGVSTRLEPVIPLPRFPKQSDVDALPRQLTYLFDPSGRAGYWHAIPAGPDATGRPGNVFAQCLLDREPAADHPSLRPIELWRAPEWCVPYGADAVRAAALPTDGAMTTRAVINPHSVMDFLLDSENWRIGTLSVLLDSVASALTGGPRVVLGAPSPDEAALWIGAVSYLLPARIARRLAFSTYQRSDGLGTAWQAGLLLAAVPERDLETIDTDIAVVLAVSEQVSLGELGGDPHVTRAGSRVTVTHWSTSAEVLLQDNQVALEVIDELDAVASCVPQVPPDPVWALACAMWHHRVHFPDAVEEIEEILVAGPVPDASADPELNAMLVGRWEERIGQGAEAAWSAIRDAGRGVDYGVALSTYLQRVPYDSDWLQQVGGAPYPDSEHASPVQLQQMVVDMKRRASEIVTDFAHAGQAQQIGLAGLALRLLDFAYRVGLRFTTQMLAPDDRLRQLLEQVITPTLTNRTPDPLFVRVGRLDPGLRRDVLAPAVNDWLARRSALPPLGRRLDPYFLRWLFDSSVRNYSLRELLNNPAQSPSMVESEYLISIAESYGPSTDEQSIRAVALYLVLHDVRSTGRPSNLAFIFSDTPIAPEDVLRLWGLFGSLVPPRLLMRTLRDQPWDEDVTTLAERILDEEARRGHTPERDWAELVSLARLRHRAHDPNPMVPFSHRVEFLRDFSRVELPVQIGVLDREFGTPCVTAYAELVLNAVYQLRGRPAPPVSTPSPPTQSKPSYRLDASGDASSSSDSPHGADVTARTSRLTTGDARRHPRLPNGRSAPASLDPLTQAVSPPALSPLAVTGWVSPRTGRPGQRRLVDERGWRNLQRVAQHASVTAVVDQLLKALELGRFDDQALVEAVVFDHPEYRGRTTGGAPDARSLMALLVGNTSYTPVHLLLIHRIASEENPLRADLFDEFVSRASAYRLPVSSEVLPASKNQQVLSSAHDRWSELAKVAAPESTRSWTLRRGRGLRRSEESDCDGRRE